MISRLKKKGYNAMTDEAGVGGKGGPREGVAPLIIFDGEKSLTEKSTSEISKKIETKASKNFNNWSKTANSSKNRKNQW